MVKPASEVADVALAADHQNGHLQGCAADGNEADRTLLLPRQGLAGKLQAIVADECGEKVGIKGGRLGVERLPFSGGGMGFLRGSWKRRAMVVVTSCGNDFCFSSSSISACSLFNISTSLYRRLRNA